MGTASEPPPGALGSSGRKSTLRPLAWVPPFTRIDREAIQRSRIDALMFLLSGTGYMVLTFVLVGVSNLGHVLTSGSVPLATVEIIRDTLALFGWLGLWGCGLLIQFLPSQIGIPYRPVRVAHLHLVLANVAMIGFAVSSLGWGIGISADSFLILAAISYLAFSLPLLLTLVLSVQDWMTGGL
ncbi:MAG: hypothetical protein ACRECR_04185 [Thermoplasmata archaeon]